MTVLSSGLSDVKIDSAVFTLHMNQPAGVSVGADGEKEPSSRENDMLGSFSTRCRSLVSAGRQCSDQNKLEKTQHLLPLLVTTMQTYACIISLHSCYLACVQ